MRHVIVPYILLIILNSLSRLEFIFAQESFLWSDPQLSSEEWHPFIPSNYVSHGERQFQSYPKTDTVRQFFGKTSPEPIQPAVLPQSPVLKKSFQASPAPSNNIEQYSNSPVLGSFNSFGVQSIQSRNPIFDKNIKDSQLLEQPTQYHLKYQPQPQQQLSTTLHRFPAYFPSTFDHFQKQPSLNAQQAVFHGHPVPSFAANRYENSLKQTPSRTPVSTTIQVFPPPQVNGIQSSPIQHQNTFYLNVPPPPKEDYIDNDSSFDHKRNRPIDYQSSNIYNTKDANSGSVKNVAFVSRLEQQSNPNPFFDNVKSPPTDKFEYVFVNNNNPNRGSPVQQNIPTFSNTFGNEQVRGVNGASLRTRGELGKKKNADEMNPSRQVFEQLSPLGRPFTLPKEGSDIDSQSLSSYSSLPRPSSNKRTKTKTSQSVSDSTPPHRLPGGNSVHSLIDYESGKLQAVKSVTYVPQREVIKFNENDLLINNPLGFHSSTENQPFVQNSFLPTPTDSNENGETHNENIDNHFTHNYYNRFASTSTTLAPALNGASQLPHNHKYNPANVRTRQPAHSHWRQQTSNNEDFSPQTASLPVPNENVDTLTNDKNNYETLEYETTATPPSSTTTRRALLTRRRKPTKNKNKIRTSTASEMESSSITEEYNYPKLKDDTPQRFSNYYNIGDDRSPNSKLNNNEATNAVSNNEESISEASITTTTSSHVLRRKPAKVRTTTIASEEEYPNYPLEYIHQLQEQQSSTSKPYVADISNTNIHFNRFKNENQENVKQEEEWETHKANYPTTLRPKMKPNFTNAIRNSVTSTTESTLTSSSATTTTKVRPKVKLNPSVLPNNVNLTRPRFSIKDHKRTTTVSSIENRNTATTGAPFAFGANSDGPANENSVENDKKETRKTLFALRNKNKNKINAEHKESNADTNKVVIGHADSNTDNDSIVRKYKPRIRPSKYKLSASSTTPVANPATASEATSERVNTFRPSSGGRIKSSTSKYYNRYRTTTELSKNALSDNDDFYSTNEDTVQASASNVKPTRTLLFSAKKSATANVSGIASPKAQTTITPTANKPSEYDEEDEDNVAEDEYEDDMDEDRVFSLFNDYPKKNSNASTNEGVKTKKNPFPSKQTSRSKLEKADDISATSIMSSDEEEILKTASSSSVNNNATDSDEFEEIKSKINNSSARESDLPKVSKEEKNEEFDSDIESVTQKKSEDEPSTSTTLASVTNSAYTESPTVVETTTALMDEHEKESSYESEDDVNDRVSKISMLTSQDESHRARGAAVAGNKGSNSYEHHWRFPVHSIKNISETDD